MISDATLDASSASRAVFAFCDNFGERGSVTAVAIFGRGNHMSPVVHTSTSLWIAEAHRT